MTVVGPVRDLKRMAGIVAAMKARANVILVRGVKGAKGVMMRVNQAV
jgi:hypothetical protein